MKKFLTKDIIIFITIAILFIGIFLVSIIFGYIKTSLNDPIKLLLTQKQVIVTDNEFDELTKCKTANKKEYSEETTDCFKLFYENYTLKNGMEASFKHYRSLVNKDENFTENCHYIYHGIGYGELKRENGNISSAFSVKQNSELWNDTPICSSGYFHGLIEEYALDTNDKNVLKEKLAGVCDSILKEKESKGIDCFHGIGHAALIQLGDIPSATSFCEKVTIDENMQSMCRTGVFMEMLRQESMYVSNEKILSYLPCENLPLKYQGECFNQQSYFLKEFASKKLEFMENLKECKAIKDDYERIFCIRNFKF